MSFDAVIFDLGGVVLDWEPERAFEQVLDATDVPAFLDRVGFHEWNRANDALDGLAEAEAELTARYPDDAEAIRAYRTHFLHSVTGMVPGTAAVIAELQRAGATVSALTNWSGELFALTRPRFGVLERFADIVVSGEEGVAKPDHRIFALACERLRLDPARTVFVDDSPTNVEASRESGLRGVPFADAEQFRAELVGLGLLAEREPVREPVFHLAARTDWARAVTDGHYPWSGRDLGYDQAGFVHCSFEHQLTRTRNRFYGGLAADEIVLLRLPTGLPVVVENGFPHLFAPLPVADVVEVDQASASL